MYYAEQLTIYVTEGDRQDGQLLYQALIKEARQLGLAGVTVMRTTIGYGQKHRQIAVDWVMELAPSMIMILTVIDQPTAIAKCIPRLQALIKNGLVIQEPVTVVHHVPNGPSQLNRLKESPQEPTMDNPNDGGESIKQDQHIYEKLTVYVGEADQWQGRTVHLALVQEARRLGLVGATAVRGATGYGKNNEERVMLLGIIELSSDLPIILTFIDRREKIEQFLPIVQEAVTGGIVLRDTIHVVHHAP
jgi:PII-like signaling protein